MNERTSADPRRYIFTGGPGTGKTTTLGCLAARGFLCVPESARTIIQERIGAGLSPRPSPAEFAAEILLRDIALYDGAPIQHEPLFFDRGIVDGLGMLHDYGAISLGEAAAHLEERPFAKEAFFFPPWEEIYTNDSERDQTYAEAIEVAQRIRSWFKLLGFRLVDVPFGARDERAEFILQKVRVTA